eukprot:COSAG03_NODE_1179_length_4634_cov_2.694004_6_plen_155_part_00
MSQAVTADSDSPPAAEALLHGRRDDGHLRRCVGDVQLAVAQAGVYFAVIQRDGESVGADNVHTSVRREFSKPLHREILKPLHREFLKPLHRGFSKTALYISPPGFAELRFGVSGIRTRASCACWAPVVGLTLRAHKELHTQPTERGARRGMEPS